MWHVRAFKLGGKQGSFSLGLLGELVSYDDALELLGGNTGDVPSPRTALLLVSP